MIQEKGNTNMQRLMLTSFCRSCLLIRDANRAPNVKLPMATIMAAADTVNRLAYAYCTYVTHQKETSQNTTENRMLETQTVVSKIHENMKRIYLCVFDSVDQRESDGQYIDAHVHNNAALLQSFRWHTGYGLMMTSCAYQASLLFSLERVRTIRFTVPLPRSR